MPTVKIQTKDVTIEITANEASITELGNQAIDLYRRATPNATQPFGFDAKPEEQAA